MSLQNTFNPDLLVAYAGQWADITDTDAHSRLVKFSPIPFGVAAVRADSDTSCRLPDAGDVLGAGATTAAANVLQGIVMFQANNPDTNQGPLEAPVGLDDIGYMGVTDSASLARHGNVWVIPEVAVTQGEPVFYRATLTDPAANPQTEQLGALTNTADGGNCIEIVGAKWYSSTANAGEYAILSLSGV